MQVEGRSPSTRHCIEREAARHGYELSSELGHDNNTLMTRSNFPADYSAADARRQRDSQNSWKLWAGPDGSARAGGDDSDSCSDCRTTPPLGFVFSSRTFRDPCTCLRDGTYSVPCNPRRVSPFCKHASVRNMVLRGVGCCSQPSHAHCQCHSCAWDTVPVAAHAEAYRDARPRGVRVERPDIRNVCARGHRQANERNVVCVAIDF